MLYPSQTLPSPDTTLKDFPYNQLISTNNAAKGQKPCMMYVDAIPIYFGTGNQFQVQYVAYDADVIKVQPQL